ncbi:MAG: hypothetical protein NZ561_02230, partial [Phycisphaerae bacterium]|nr:hypothetical protein [Phycisphaerae bacterium]
MNFQPAGAPVPAGFEVDVGSKFGARANDFIFGWDFDNTGSMRRRTSALSLDAAFDTLAHMNEGNSPRKWELAVPNGTYHVRVVAGDAAYYDSIYKINVENVLVVNGTPTPQNRWISGSAKVAVNDGRLTVTNASGSKNNKINFIEVVADESVRVSVPTTVPAGWSSIAPLPLARTEAQQAVKNGLLYVFGGFYNSGWDATRRVDVYDPAADRWTRLPDMPTLVTHAATVVDGNNVILVGGYVGHDPGQATKDVWKFHVRNKSWTRLPSLPAPRGAGGAGIVGTTLYFFSGHTRKPDGTHQADHSNTWALDLANLSAGWKAKAAFPHPRNHMGYATVGGKIYAIGGQLGAKEASGNQSSVHVYHPGTNTWSTAAPLPMPLGHIHTGTLVEDGRIIIAGGVTNGFVNTDLIHSYDPATNVWSRVGTLPGPRKSINLMIHQGVLYFAGGGNNTALRSGFKTAWAPLWQSMKSMPVALGEVAAGVIGNKLYLFGEGSHATLSFNLSNNTWSTSELPQRPFGGHHHGAEVLNGKLYLIGGLGASAGRLQIFDPVARKWTLGPNIPFSTGSAATAVIRGKIYVAGGIVGSSSSNPGGTATTDLAAVYNPATNAWSMIAPMPRGVNHAASGTDGSKFYVFGGRDGKN